MPTRRAFLLSAVTALASAPLKDRRADARAITPGERLARVERARTLMASLRIGAICVAGGTSLAYFSGVQWHDSERLFVMILPVRGDPFFICPAFEEGRAREQIAANANLRGAQVYAW